MLLVQSAPGGTFTTSSFTDITSAQVTRVEMQGSELFIEFASDLTDAEQVRVLERTRRSPNETTIRSAATTAIDSNAAWRTNVYPQLITGADQIIAATSSSTQEKDLARAVKTLANQVRDLSLQNGGLARLLLQRFEATT